MLSKEYRAYLEAELLQKCPMRYNVHVAEGHQDHKRMEAYLDSLPGEGHYTDVTRANEDRFMFLLFVLESDGEGTIC